MTPEVRKPLNLCFVAPSMRDLRRAATHLLRNNSEEIVAVRRMAPMIIRFRDGTEVRFFSNGHVGFTDGYRFDQVFEVHGCGFIHPDLAESLRLDLLLSCIPEDFQWQIYEED